MLSRPKPILLNNHREKLHEPSYNESSVIAFERKKNGCRIYFRASSHDAVSQD